MLSSNVPKPVQFTFADIGTKTCRFICSVPTSVKPSISSCGVHLDNSLSSVAAAWGIYISSNVPKPVQFTFTVYVAAFISMENEASPFAL